MTNDEEILNQLNTYISCDYDCGNGEHTDECLKRKLALVRQDEQNKLKKFIQILEKIYEETTIEDRDYEEAQSIIVNIQKITKKALEEVGENK